MIEDFEKDITSIGYIKPNFKKNKKTRRKRFFAIICSSVGNKKSIMQPLYELEPQDDYKRKTKSTHNDANVFL